jgi:hypothetical protein
MAPCSARDLPSPSVAKRSGPVAQRSPSGRRPARGMRPARWSPAAGPRGGHKGASCYGRPAWPLQRNERARWCQQHLQQRCNRDHFAHVSVVRSITVVSEMSPSMSETLGRALMSFPIGRIHIRDILVQYTVAVPEFPCSNVSHVTKKIQSVLKYCLGRRSRAPKMRAAMHTSVRFL